MRGPDDMMLRRGWTAPSPLCWPGPGSRAPAVDAGPTSPGESPPRRRLGLAMAALMWPRAVETPVATKPATHIVAPELGARRLTLDGGVEAKLSSASVMRLEGGAPRVEGGEVRFSVPRRRS